jgi:hypothetical protein
MLGSCVIAAEDGTPSRSGNIVFMPMSDVVIEPSWFVTGLQGTGSDTVAAYDVFVPNHMMMPIDRAFGYAETRIRHIGAHSDQDAYHRSRRSSSSQLARRFVEIRWIPLDPHLISPEN